MADRPRWLRHLLWIDGVSGLTAGAGGLVLQHLLATLYGLPRGLVVTIAMVNVAYGLFGVSLARQATRRVAMVSTLAAANLTWACVCLGLVASHWTEATPLGVAVLLFEAAYVATLGTTEWRWREPLGRGVAA